VITLAMGMSATIARLTRATLLQVLNQDFIRTARAKGLHENMVLYRHALRNSMIPVVTILGPLLAAVLTGTFVVEIVFAIPGLGDTFVTSVTTRDYNLLVGVTVLYSVFLVAANILVDVLYVWLDPRIKLQD
jgi:oligopeptide transport system permease protein